MPKIDTRCWDPPQEWFECAECDGYGFIARRVTVYEHGCGFPHDDTSEELCASCNGAGGWLEDSAGDEMTRALIADGEKLQQLTGEDHGPARFCDCCDKPFPRDQVSRVWVTGIETFACDECRGGNGL